MSKAVAVMVEPGMAEMATISKLSINANAKLDSAVKKHLISIIEDEFDRRTELSRAERSSKEEAILKQIKKESGFAALVKENEKLAEQVELARGVFNEKCEKLANETKKNEIKMYKLGFCEDGQIWSYTKSRRAMNKKDTVGCESAAKEIEAKIQKELSVSDDLCTLRNKIISRMLLSQTIGEATVIVREVLGNDIIPTLTRNDVAMS